MEQNLRGVLHRIDYGEKQTLGLFYLVGEDGFAKFTCITLELPYLDNERDISCIKEGEYEVIPRRSNKFGKHFHILNVEDRDHILIHSGNFNSQTQGCILVGSDLKDLNSDEVLDLTESKITLKKMLKIVPNGFRLTITSAKA